MNATLSVACPLGLYPFSGVCADRGECVSLTAGVSGASGLSLTAGVCACRRFFSGHGDLFAAPATDCHIVEWLALVVRAGKDAMSASETERRRKQKNQNTNNKNRFFFLSALIPPSPPRV